MKIFFLFISLMFSFLLFAQKPNIEWQEKRGFNNDDEFYRVVRSGGSYTIGGMYRTLNDMPQSWLLSYSNDGIVYWEKKLNFEYKNLINAIAINNDYTITIGGYTYERRQYTRDLYFMRFAADGKTLYFKKVNGGKFKDGASDILALGDGGNIIFGYFSDNENQNLWVIRITKYGNELWKKNYNLSAYDVPVRVTNTNDRNIILCSNSLTENKDWDVTLTKLKLENGIQMWSKKIGNEYNNSANDFIMTNDSSYVLCGVSESKDKGKDFWVVKTDKEANVIWEKTFGWSMNEEANGIYQRINGNYIVCGYTESKGKGMYDFWVMELDAEGNMIWESTYGTDANDIAYDITETDDGGIIVVGSTFNGENKLDGWIIKLK